MDQVEALHPVAAVEDLHRAGPGRGAGGRGARLGWTGLASVAALHPVAVLASVAALHPVAVLASVEALAEVEGQG